MLVSGDGYLSVFDMRKGVLEARSDQEEEDLLSIALVKVSMSSLQLMWVFEIKSSREERRC